MALTIETPLLTENFLEIMEEVVPVIPITTLTTQNDLSVQCESLEYLTA